jgi:hypothetical protein
MEGFSFVTPVTGLNRPNTGKEDFDDEHHATKCPFAVLSKDRNIYTTSRVSPES